MSLRTMALQTTKQKRQSSAQPASLRDTNVPSSDISPPRLNYCSRAGRRCPGAFLRALLERVAVGFAGPNPQGVINRRHENLAIADLSSAGARGDHLNRLLGDVGRDRDLDPQFREKIHHIFGAAIDFGVALLAAVTLDLGDGHAVHADGGQRLPDLVQLERFDNGDNELHVQAFISRIEKVSQAVKGSGTPLPPSPQ